MNSSVYSADRATHLRVLTVALVASITIVGFAISARVNAIEMTQTMTIGRSQKAEIPKAAAAAPGRLETRHI